MRRHSLVTLLALALALPVGTMAGPAIAAPSGKSCTPAGYSHNNVACVFVPSKGSFSVKIPLTKDKLLGTGSKGTAGTEITVTHLSPPMPSKHGYGLRVRAAGKFPPLKVSSGKLWTYNHSKNRLTASKTITASGVYQVTK